MTSSASFRRQSASSHALLPRLITRAAWSALAHDIVAMARGGGVTNLRLTTKSVGNVRWARNRINTSGDCRNNTLTVARAIQGATANMTVNQTNDCALRATVRYVERLLGRYAMEAIEVDTPAPFGRADYLQPTLWFDSTVALDGGRRAEAAQRAIEPAEKAGMVSAGYLEVTSSGLAVYRPEQSMDLYYPVTEAQYSLTVRDPNGTGSGWAGVSWNDWSRIDVDHIAAVALDKCLRSRNPVALEPGRYTAILEPQAVYDITKTLVDPLALDWQNALADKNRTLPYSDPDHRIGTKLGQRLLDPRVSVRADPMDPELGVVPFTTNGEPIVAADWFVNGVLTTLAYSRAFAVQQGLGDLGKPASGAYRLSATGAPTSIEEMIATTPRGILVTRFWDVGVVGNGWASLLSSGWTRDGTWLIERGKISKPVKNFLFRESPLFMLNQIEQVGVPARVFSPGSAAMVPALKVRDFSFVALSDGV